MPGGPPEADPGCLFETRSVSLPWCIEETGTEHHHIPAVRAPTFAVNWRRLACIAHTSILGAPPCHTPVSSCFPA